MDRQYDVIIAGAGAAGITAAVRAAERGRKVLVLEKGDRIGRKILASGNGRCNLMNYAAPRYYGDSAFALQALECCSIQAIAGFLKQYGLLLAQEADGRVYPLSYQSASVVSVLNNALNIAGAKVVRNTGVASVCRRGNCFAVQCENGEAYSAERVIIACGGAVQPKLGGSYDGYTILKSMGHTVIKPVPSLVPLKTDKRSISGLSGIRVRCRIRLCGQNGILHEEKGEILFTDYGVSGICIMQCARFADPDRTYLLVDFIGDAFPDRARTADELKRRQQLFTGLSPVTLLDGIVPSKVSYAIMKQAGIPLRGETAGELSAGDIESIAETASAYRINVTGTKDMDFAQVTAGGADCGEFDPSTMQSRIVPGLYAAGEVLNVDGDCGGFNLMFAFASGMIAGQNV